MKIKLMGVGIIIIGVIAVLLLSIYSSNGEDNPLIKFVLGVSEREIVFAKIQKIDSNSEQIGFKLPSEGRSWPLYIKGESLSKKDLSSDATINFSIINDSIEDIELRIREINENIIKSFKLRKGEEKVLYTGNIETFIFEFSKDNLLRSNDDDTYSEWHPLISISAVSGKKLTGRIKLISSDVINLSDPIIIYTYLPSDTL